MFEKDKTIYKVCLKCKNCGDEEDYDIPKGKTVKEFVKKVHCKRCNCLTINDKMDCDC